MESSNSHAPVALVDSHVHFHACYAPEDFLDGADRNVRRWSAGLHLEREPLGLLVLTAGEAEPSFDRWLSDAASQGSARWSFEPTDERESVLALLAGEVRLILVAGRQIRTAERLEVLALACNAELSDGLGLVETLEAVRAVGVPAVVPWGFGKWSFGRGRLLESVLPDQDPSFFFLGDNGGRPRAYPRPGLFATAESQGVRILPGSDPLPFRPQARRAGSCGFVLRRPLPTGRPGGGLRAALEDTAFVPEVYGSRESVAGFARNQVAMQLRRRGWRSAS